MRQIKFRAWDVSNKVMYTHTELLDGGIVNPSVLTDCLVADGTGYDTDTVLLQFTGLKDKNGKEIYEGDIVNQDGFLGSVVYREPAFVLWLKEPVHGADGTEHEYYSDWYNLTRASKGVEIIGNIYENPELLK